MHTPYDAVPGWNTSIPCEGYGVVRSPGTELTDDDSNGGGGSTYCGMLWESDQYMGQLEAVLRKKGMWNNTLIVYFADNGGVGDGINYPLRGEKHSNWEGGMRAAAFVSGGLIPPALRGTTNDIVFHAVDWYPTLCKLAGVDPSDDPPVAPLPADITNPDKDLYGTDSFPPVDGVDIWEYLTQPQGHSSNAAHATLTLSKEVIVAGDYKLLVAQPNFKANNNGWRYPNGSWVESVDADWPCNKQDGPLDQVLPGIWGNDLCLFDVASGKCT